MLKETKAKGQKINDDNVYHLKSGVNGFHCTAVVFVRFFFYFCSLPCTLLYSTDDNPRFAEYFHDHIKTTAAEFFTLLVFSYRDGFDGVEQVVRNRVVSEYLPVQTPPLESSFNS